MTVEQRLGWMMGLMVAIWVGGVAYGLWYFYGRQR
jgi:hypothetical protein